MFRGVAKRGEPSLRAAWMRRGREQVMIGQTIMVVGPGGPLISLICFTCLLVGCYTMSSKHSELKVQ